jgi:hypothetical protein
MSISVPEVERRVPDSLCVESAYGYYAPYSWRKDCQSIEHLAMIRAAYEGLLGLGMEVKPLTLPSYGKSYPDLLAVSEPREFRLAFGGAPAEEGIVELLVECETGKKPGREAGEKLLQLLRDKLGALRRKPLLKEPEEKEEQREGGEPGEEERGKERGEKGEREEKEGEKATPVSRAMLLVLSPGLYAAYERLMEEKQDPILLEAKRLEEEKRLFFTNVEDLLR